MTFGFSVNLFLSNVFLIWKRFWRNIWKRTSISGRGEFVVLGEREREERGRERIVAPSLDDVMVVVVAVLEKNSQVP